MSRILTIFVAVILGRFATEKVSGLLAKKPTSIPETSG